MKPPKDKTFLANIGFPYYVFATWSGAMNYYVYAELEIDLLNGVWNDVYFTTESFKEDELISWKKVPNLKKNNLLKG